MSEGPAPSRWILRPRPLPEARVRLLCIPHAGGGASSFRPWAADAPPWLELCPVQLPGREARMRETPYADWRPLVDALAAEARPFLDLPWAVLGHSSGAMLGFELVRALRRVGGPEPVHLFASGRRAPHLPLGRATTYALPEPELIDDLRALGGVPAEVLAHREMMALLLPMIRADLAVNETYAFEPEAPLEVPITAFGGDDDARVPPATVEAWREHTRGAFAVCTLPGGHFFPYEQRARMLAAIVTALEGARGA